MALTQSHEVTTHSTTGRPLARSVESATQVFTLDEGWSQVVDTTSKSVVILNWFGVAIYIPYNQVLAYK